MPTYLGHLLHLYSPWWSSLANIPTKFLQSSYNAQNWVQLLCLCTIPFLKKYGLIRTSFCLFLSFSHYNFKTTNCKKRRWCAWDSNPHDGRCRWYHGAMAATLCTIPFYYKALNLQSDLKFQIIVCSKVLRQTWDSKQSLCKYFIHCNHFNSLRSCLAFATKQKDEEDGLW